MSFNLRVYGLVINANGEILISEERRSGFEFCKFPGGGVQKGEGILEALHREFKEELLAEITEAKFFYFNEFYQPSSFNPMEQIICFYYLVRLKQPQNLILNVKNTPINGSNDDFERFRWAAIEDLKEGELTFPIDKIILKNVKLILIKN